MDYLIDLAVDLFHKIINYFRDDFDVEKILVAIVGYFIIKILTSFYKNIKRNQRKHSQFNITGFWVARFPSFVYKDRNIIELYYIKQKSSELDIKIQHYSDSREDVSKLYGKGEIRESFISFFYSTAKKDSKVLGAACLKVANEDVEVLNLRGNCYEDHSHLSQKQRDDIYKLQKKDILILKKIDIPWNKRIAFKFGLNVFRNYKKFKEFVEKNNGI